MALFDFKSDKHFVTSPDETTIRVFELSDPTVHPSDIRKADWKEVATIDIVDGGNKGGGNSAAEGKYFHHGLLFFDEHGKIEGQEALTKLARHLARSGLMVSPGGCCFQDVTGLGEHRDFGAHYLRLNDLFSWPSHGVDLARITTWRRLELTYTVPRHKKISKQPMVGGVVVSKEKYEELKKRLSMRDEELEKVTNEMEDEIQKLREEKEEAVQKMREEMEETIEKKDAELRKVKRERDNEKRLKEMIERASKEKYEESRRMVRGKNEELEKLRDELEEDVRKLRDEKAGEMQKLKEEIEDTSEKHEKELKRSRKEKDELQEKLNKKDVLLGRASDDLQKLRKEKTEELRKLREERQEEVENARKEKDEEVESLKREKNEGEKPSKEQDEELKNLRDEVETLRRTKDDEAGKATKKEEEMEKMLEMVRKDKEGALQRLINEKDVELEKLRNEREETMKEYAAETRKLRDQMSQHEREQLRKQSWIHPPTTRYITDEMVHKSRRRPVPPNSWSDSEPYFYCHENSMKADLSGFFRVNFYVQVVDEDTQNWPAPQRVGISYWGTNSFDKSNWWFVKIVHPEDGGLTMLAYYDRDQSYATGYNGHPARFPFRLNAFMGTNTRFFIIRLFEEYMLAFLYRD